MKIVIYDIEVLKRIYLINIYIPERGEWREFGVHQFDNSIDEFVSFAEEYADYFWVGFNCISYDSQIVEYILRNSQYWHDKDWKEICLELFQKSIDTISDSNYGLLPFYRENQLSIKQLDLFTIFHFNNENRRTSLKAVAVALNIEDIEELPISPYAEHLTFEDITRLSLYCRKDVTDTYQLYLVARGLTENPLYKGKDKIADRLIMKEEFGLDCLNWDDVKIGSEWNKLDYLKLSGKSERDIRPEKIIYPFGKKFKTFFPKYIKFQSPSLIKFINDIGEKFIINRKQEFRYKFNDNLTATIAKGGIHSNETGRFIRPNRDEIYYQCDIGSQYPNAIRKYKIEPKHLPGWNSLIVSKIERRLHFKHLFKETKDPKYASLQEMGKLALNGGALTNKFGIKVKFSYIC